MKIWKESFMKKLIALLLVLVFMLSLTACGKDDATADTSDGSAGTEGSAADTTDSGKQIVKVGFDLPFTGSAADQVSDYQQGVMMALEDLEASGALDYYEFEFIWEDDKADVTEAMNCVNKLIYEEEVHILCGPFQSTISTACANIWEEAGVCAVVPGWAPSLTQSGYQYTIRSNPNDQIACNTVISHMVETMGYEKIAMIYINDEQGQPGYDYSVAALSEYGMELCAAETFTSDDKDMTGQLMRIREAEPEAIFYYGGSVADAAVCMQQIYDLFGDSVAVYASTIVGQGSFVELVEPEVYEDIIFFTGWAPNDRTEFESEFTERFREWKGEDPSDLPCRGYDALMIIATALDSMGEFDVNSETFRDDLNTAMHQVQYEGLQGTFQFDETGDGLDSCLLVQYQDGVQTILS